MAQYRARISWKRGTPDFSYNTYDRTHWWEFGGGVRLQASAAPEFKGDGALVNPEEALVAALSSCHMLTFLALAAGRRFTVDEYEDDATGVVAKNADGRLAVTQVVLRPRIAFGGEKQPTPAELQGLHDKAHEQCFIANSVRTDIVIEPQ